MDQVITLKKTKTLKNTGKMEINTGKVRELCRSGKVTTMVASEIYFILGRKRHRFQMGSQRIQFNIHIEQDQR